MASGARVTSCSHSRFEGGELSPIFPRRFRSQRRVHVSLNRNFLEGAAGSVRPFKGVSSIASHFGLRSDFPIQLGLARDVPLAGAPALDAQFTECERASAPMEKGTNGFWEARLSVQNRLAMVYPSVTVIWFSADVGRTQRVPPTSIPLQEEV